MTNPEDGPQDDKSAIKQDTVSTDGEQKSMEKAPGKRSESGYPNDDYWEQDVRENPKEPPDETPEPDNGYRWESAEDASTSQAADDEDGQD